MSLIGEKFFNSDLVIIRNTVYFLIFFLLFYYFHLLSERGISPEDDMHRYINATQAGDLIIIRRGKVVGSLPLEQGFAPQSSAL
jgi:hypothetical protein